MVKSVTAFKMAMMQDPYDLMHGHHDAKMDGRRRYAWCGSSKKSLKCRQSGGQGGYDRGIDDPKTVFDSFYRWATAYQVKPISNEMVRELRAWTDS